MRARCRRVVTLPMVVALLAIACDGDGDGPFGLRAPGSIRVMLAPSGHDIITAGIRVKVANGPVGQFAAGTSFLTIPELEPGTHTVGIDALSANCEATGINPRQVTVQSRLTTTVVFHVVCAPRVGEIRLTTTTTGADLDSDGYTANVMGLMSQDVPVSGTATIPNVREGSRHITLTGVAPNCAVAEPDTLAITIDYGETTDATFSVQCHLAGMLRVTTTTTGVDLDVDGYTVTVQATSVGISRSLPVEHTGEGTFSRLLPAADYRVSLQGVAANCDVGGGSTRTMTVVAGATTDVAFELACTVPPLLAVTREGDVYAIRSNGVAVARLTTDAANDGSPAWSPNGKIAFTTNRHGNDVELYVMNEDGTNPTRITVSAGEDDSPSWSPDGQRIVFRSSRNVNSEIYVVNPDGSGLIRLTNDDASDTQPAWSSTGKIVFVSTRDHPAGELYVMNSDGSNVVRLTTNEAAELGPTWSPDGSRIAFARAVECDYTCVYDIFVIDADGANPRRLTTAWAPYQSHSDPSWTSNGRWIAFSQDLCGYYGCDERGVWMVEAQGTDLRKIVEGSSQPAWRP